MMRLTAGRAFKVMVLAGAMLFGGSAVDATSLDIQSAWAQGDADSKDKKAGDKKEAPPKAPEKPTAKAQTVVTLIEKGSALYDDQEYEESIQTLSAALMRPAIAASEKIEVYRLLAYNYIVLQRTEEADGAVRGLLVLDPKFELSAAESPRFRDFFKTTRDKWKKEGRPGYVDPDKVPPRTKNSNVNISHTSPAQVDADAPIDLDGTIKDPGAQVSKLYIYFRTAGAGSFQKKRVTYTMHRFKTTIPDSVVAAPLVEYYLEAFNKRGESVAQRGTEDSPLRIAVDDTIGVFESPWFWIPVGAAAVAAIVVTAVLVSTSGDPDAGITVNLID